MTDAYVVDEERPGEKQVTGYADRWSVERGEQIQFMVSCETDEYEADIVKLICGDINPEGPGFKEAVIETPVSGVYPGTEQELDPGSYAVIPDDHRLQLGGSFTLQAMVYPTTPGRGVQGILTKWIDTAESGYGLFVDEKGRLSLRVGGEEGTAAVHTTEPLDASSWHFVAGSFDAETGTISVYKETFPANEYETSPIDEVHFESISEATSLTGVATNEAPFVMAGFTDDEGRVAGNFNGKIDRPRVSRSALDIDEMKSLVNRQPTSNTAREALVAKWDFSDQITPDGIRDYDTITDDGPNELHGRLVNLPARAVTGYNWDSDHHDFTKAPEQYAAIHFHSDDLTDAGWDVSFTLDVPDDFESAVYAARLRTPGDEYYVPFFVRPERGTSSADIAFLAPTNSYLAYGNERFASAPGYFENHMGGLPTVDKAALSLMANPEPGLSLYDTHVDGHGSMFSSRLRPLLNMSPKVLFGGGPPSHLHQFNADLYIIDWLEEKGYDYDVITDVDLHEEGVDLLSRYSVVLTGHHPEYYSSRQWKAIKAYQDAGGSLMYLGGNGFYWVIAFHPENPQIIEVRRGEVGTETWVPEPGELFHAFTGEKGGLWRKRGRPPQKLTGVGFSAQWEVNGTYYRRNDDSYEPETKFIFEGVEGETFGDFGLLGGGAAGEEIDRFDSSLGSPEHAYVLASSEGHSEYPRQVTEESPVTEQFLDGRMNPRVRSDLVYYKTSDSSGVFSVGSMAWVGSLSHNDYDNGVSKITENVLDAFASEEHLP